MAKSCPLPLAGPRGKSPTTQALRATLGREEILRGGHVNHLQLPFPPLHCCCRIPGRVGGAQCGLCLTELMAWNLFRPLSQCTVIAT